MRVLLIADYAPPYNKIGAVRVGKTAKYLIKSGHDVRILTSHHSDEHDLSLPIEFDEKYLIYADAQRFSEIVPLAFSNETAFRRLLIRVYLLLRYRNLFYFFREDSLAWLPVATSVGQKTINLWKPDIIFSSALPFVSHIVASKLAKKNKIPWVAEYRDLWSSGHGARVSFFSKIIYTLIEKKILASVKTLVTVSNPLAEYLATLHKKKVIVVFNGYDLSDAAPINFPLSDSNLPLRIVYLGSIYEGRDPSPLFKAIQNLKINRRHIKVDFYTEKNSKLSQLVEDYQLSDVVTINPRVTYQKSLEIQASADILLFLSYSSKHQQGEGILSGKAFEYLGARKQILSIGHDDGHVLCKDGLMVNLYDPILIKQKLEEWINLKIQRGSVPSNISIEKTYKWSREYQTSIIEGELLTLSKQSK